MVMEIAGAAASLAGSGVGHLLTSKAALIATDEVTRVSWRIECQFNPEKYSLERTVSTKASGQTEGGTDEYTGTSTTTLTMQLFFDEFASPFGNVAKTVDKVLALTEPTRQSQERKKPCPPLVRLDWGRNPQVSSVRGYITRVSVQYLLFAADGTPIQARVDLSLAGRPVPLALNNPTSHATDARRARTLAEGETLHSIATAELGQPQYWRAIAALNGIDDPGRVKPGMTVLIPSPADVQRMG